MAAVTKPYSSRLSSMPGLSRMISNNMSFGIPTKPRVAIANSGVVGSPLTLAAALRMRLPAEGPGVVELAASPVEDA
eukprot:4845584-Lingulodinium_polyedra.AAC.1